MNDNAKKTVGPLRVLSRLVATEIPPEYFDKITGGIDLGDLSPYGSGASKSVIDDGRKCVYTQDDRCGPGPNGPVRD